MRRRKFLNCIACLSALPSPLMTAPATAAESLAQQPRVQRFIARMRDDYAFDEAELQNLFGGIETDEKVLKLIGTPSAPPRKIYWLEYRKNRVTPKNILLGKQFMQKHRTALNRAAVQFGVPPQVITAIIGIETRYGAFTGNHPVVRALATLAFAHPRRGEEFLGELIEFLLYTRDNNITPTAIRGSYAGAFGIPQFLPSSVREFGLDFDGNGTVDVFDATDAIGCVANFLSQKGGWQAGTAISYAVVRSRDPAVWVRRTTDNAYRPAFTYDEFIGDGNTIDGEVPAAESSQAYLFVDLENRYDTEYRLGTRNFYALTRYNKSFKYAAAVTDLARAIADT